MEGVRHRRTHVVVAKEEYEARHAAVTKKEDAAVAKTEDGSIVWAFRARLVVVCAEHDDGMIAGRRTCSREGMCLMME